MKKGKKQAILKAAEKLFAENGFAKTTVGDIASASGVHEASVYSSYKNKKNLLFAAHGAYIKNSVTVLKEHFLGMKEPGPKLRKAIWHFLADMQSTPANAKIYMMAQRENPDFYASEHFIDLKEYARLVLDVVISGQEDGFFRQDISPRLIRAMAMGTSAFVVFHSVVHNAEYDPHELSDVIYELVIKGTRAKPETGHDMNKNGVKERAEFRRAQIIDSAIQVFSNKGFTNATISEIAGVAGLGDATLYEYFDNKEDILLNLPETYLRRLSSDDEFILPPDAPEAEKKLRELLWRWIWLLYTNERFSQLFILEHLRNASFYSSSAFTLFDDFLGKIQKAVEQGQTEGIFVQDVSFTIYRHMVVGTIDQFLLSHLLLKRPPPGIAELSTIVDSLIRTIKNDE